MKRRILKSLVLSVLCLVAGVQPALAYIDPSAGGMLFQILAVLFASLSALVLIFSRQIRTLFARVKRSLRGLLSHQPESVRDNHTTPDSAEQLDPPAASPEPNNGRKD